MGRKIIILGCLLLALASFAQEGRYRVNVRGELHQRKNARCGEYLIEAVLNNGDRRTIKQGGFGTAPFRINETITIPNKNTIRRIYFWAKRHHKKNCKKKNKHTGDTYLNVRYPYDCFYSIKSNHGTGLFGDGLWHADLEVRITPLIEVQSPGIDNFLPVDHQIAINASPGFPQRRSSYTWQYSIDNGRTFRNVPNRFQGRATINVSARDVLGSAVTRNIGTKIQFRVRSCNGRSISRFPRTYTIVPSAPTFISKQETMPSCYEATDGSVRFTFSRPLIAREKLSILPKAGSALFPSTTELQELEPDPITGAKTTYTIRNLSPGTYTATVLGFYDAFNTYTDDAAHEMRFTIRRPTPVVIDQVAVTPNWCNDGDADPTTNNDGSILVTAKGGNPGVYQISYRKTGASYSDWQDFNGGNQHRITSVASGAYEIRVQKLVNDRSVACLAYELRGGIPTTAVQVATAIIEEPPAPLQLEYITDAILHPTAAGFTNGQIKVRVFGGTPLDGNTYNYTWRDGMGNSLTTVTPSVEIDGSGNPQFFITLAEIGEGEYTLSVTDKNYVSATNQVGCFVANSSYALEDPDPLVLELEETRSISCHPDSATLDKDTDGILTANAEGGVPLDPLDNRGYLYYYTWKKKNAAGVWETIRAKHIGTPVLENLIAGEYAVNIEDANGIVIGTYRDNELVTPTDVTRPLVAPDPIVISVDQQDVYCHGGNDGYIHLNVTGGTGKYTVRWLDDRTITSLDRDQLYEDDYTVRIEDGNGCSATQTISITQPTNPLSLNYPSAFKDPSAFGLTDGWVEATIEGGTALADGSYTFVWTDTDGRNWNTNAVTRIDPVTNAFVVRLENVGAGTYSIVITDAHHTLATVQTGCTSSGHFTLQEPQPLEVVIVEDTPISCHQDNAFDNPYSDGVLIAHARGGVRFGTGLPYAYTWKRQTTATTWEVLDSQTDSIARNLGDGTYAVNIEDANGIVLGEYVNNVLTTVTDSTFVFRAPALLELSLEQQPVYCYGGSDGGVTPTVTGGTAPYTYLWNTGATTAALADISAGTYEVVVTDARGCEALASIEVEEPTAPLTIVYTAFSRPSRIGANDAWIEAEVAGGTPLADGSYHYRWENAAGESLAAQTTFDIATDGTVLIRLSGITAGTYYLSIEDGHYALATTQEGCTLRDSAYTIYEPIEAVIEELTPISCNQLNTHLDPYSDGALVGHVTGGVPFATGLPYRYTWKKQLESGSWEVLPAQTDSIARDLATGHYALNAEDSRGQLMGVYESDILQQVTDSIFHFKEPALLTLATSATAISCDTGDNGTATVAITGGVPPYHIEWSTGGTAPTIIGLISGTYIAYVTDSRGCQAEASIFIPQPGGLVTTVLEAKDPTCFEGNDGRIVLDITGGTPPYTYEWNTGVAATTLENLRAGSYRLEIEDANGCKAFQEVVLTDPKPVAVALGEERTICIGQALALDISIEDSEATYRWESANGFSSTSPTVSLTTPGVYRATVTNALGCVGMDEVTVSFLDAPIDADFLIATQAYTHEEVVLVNVSNPIGDTVRWTVPEGAVIVSETAEKLVVRFETEGVYPIQLRSQQGDCFEEYAKNIIVQPQLDTPVPSTVTAEFIQELLVYPNPANGNFTVKISLLETADVNIELINLISSHTMSTREGHDASEYAMEYVTGQLSAGIYLLSIETPKGSAIRKLVIE